MATITTGAPEVPLWLWILIPVGVGLVTAAPGLIRWWIDAHRKAQERADQGRHLRRLAVLAPRLEATADAVLGTPADLSLGRPERVRGLVEMIGPPNGTSVMDHVTGLEDQVAGLKADVGAIKSHLGMGAH